MLPRIHLSNSLQTLHSISFTSDVVLQWSVAFRYTRNVFSTAVNGILFITLLPSRTKMKQKRNVHTRTKQVKWSSTTLQTNALHPYRAGPNNCTFITVKPGLLPCKFYFGHRNGDRNYLNCHKVGSSVAKLGMQSSQGYIQSPLDKSHWQNFPKFIMVDYQVSKQYFTMVQINQRGSVDTDLSPWNRLQNEQAFLEVNVLIWGTLILNLFPRRSDRFILQSHNFVLQCLRIQNIR